MTVCLSVKVFLDLQAVGVTWACFCSINCGWWWSSAQHVLWRLQNLSLHTSQGLSTGYMSYLVVVEMPDDHNIDSYTIIVVASIVFHVAVWYVWCKQECSMVLILVEYFNTMLIDIETIIMIFFKEHHQDYSCSFLLL